METKTTLALLISILGIASVAGAAAYQDLPDQDIRVEDENVTVNVSTFVALDADDVGENGRDFVVFNSSGARMNESFDYNTSSDPIAIEATSGGNLTDNSTATVSYTYTGKPLAAQTVAGLAASIVNVLALLGVIGAAIYTLAMGRDLLRATRGGLR